VNPIRNLLVIVDPTADVHPAVDKAALLAEKLDARLELFICDTKAARDVRIARHARSQAEEPLVVDLKSILEELAKPLRARGIDVATEVECDDPLHVGLIDRARRTSADLIVKDTHHHSLARRTFMTNTDWELIRACPVTLLLTKPNRWVNVPRIFAAVDPGHANDKPVVLDNRILDCASLLAKGLGGELHLLHVYLPAAIVAAAASAGPPTPIPISAQEQAREEEQQRLLLRDLITRYRISGENVHLKIGGPAEVLPRIAGALHADIMTLGAVSRSGLQRAFIGSTAEDVLEHLPCDALIVKPPDFASALPF